MNNENIIDTNHIAVNQLDMISCFDHLVPCTFYANIDANNKTFNFNYVIDKIMVKLFKEKPEEFQRLNNAGIIENSLYGDYQFTEREDFDVIYEGNTYVIDLVNENLFKDLITNDFDESFFTFFKVEPDFNIVLEQMEVNYEEESGFWWLKIPLSCDANWDLLLKFINIKKKSLEE